jgi:hypothetical protein
MARAVVAVIAGEVGGDSRRSYGGGGCLQLTLLFL